MRENQRCGDVITACVVLVDEGMNGHRGERSDDPGDGG
jgi:hypothetical protein